MPFTLACAQFAPRKADVSANLDRIAELAVQASREGADLVLFPESAASGYYLEGGVLEAALTPDEMSAGLQARLSGKLKGRLDLLVGFYERADGGLFNSAGYFEVGADGVRTVHMYRKFFLPTYGLFDEERFVASGRSLGVFDTRLGRMGVLICEDVWHSVLSTLCAVNGAQCLLIPSASPGRGFGGDDIGNHDRYRRMIRAISEEHGLYTANVQLTGFEGGKGFVGGSMVYDPFGKCVAESPLIEEHLLLADVDLELNGIARAATPLANDLKSAWSDIARLVNEVE